MADDYNIEEQIADWYEDSGGGSGVVTVTVTTTFDPDAGEISSVSIDKTFKEISDAFTSGAVLQFIQYLYENGVFAGVKFYTCLTFRDMGESYYDPDRRYEMSIADMSNISASTWNLVSASEDGVLKWGSA